MSDSEFQTSTSYRNEPVPEWVLLASLSCDQFPSEKDIVRAFKAGVDAALDRRITYLNAAALSVNGEPAIVNIGDTEPDRSKRYVDLDNDVWTYRGDDGWSYKDSLRPRRWGALAAYYTDCFPWSEVR